MSEYIVCVDDLEESYYKYTGVKPEMVFGHRLCEEIIRCRDCRHYNEQEPGGEIGTCNLGLEDLDLLFIVEPNGFCAWGEMEVDA